MSNRNHTRAELDEVLGKMGVTDQTDVSRYGSGHINDTYKVETARGVRFILQRINTDIFKDPEMLKRTIVRVTEHLASKGVATLEVVGYDNPWRLYRFLEGYTSRDVVTDASQAYAVARAFAKFQNDLADLPAPRLEDIIPKFHDTPDRLRQLDDAIRVNFKGRVANVAEELAFVDRWRPLAGRLVDLMAKGEIPERVTHNDTKINNVLVAADGTAVVIDLDTTMPGTALSDFGDMVRTSSAAAAEDEADLSKVYSKKDYFELLEVVLLRIDLRRRTTSSSSSAAISKARSSSTTSRRRTSRSPAGSPRSRSASGSSPTISAATPISPPPTKTTTSSAPATSSRWSRRWRSRRRSTSGS